MSILTFIVSVVLLGAFAALLTNGIMEGLKQIPAIDKLPAPIKFVIMLFIGAVCAWVVQDGAKDYIKTSALLMWITTIATAQLGYDKIIKAKLETVAEKEAEVGFIKSDNAASK